MTLRHCVERWPGAILASLMLAVALAQISGWANGAPTTDVPAAYYVQAGAPAGGDGSRARPFASLTLVQEVAGPGATIYLLPSERDELLDGGISLRARQKLIGLGPEGVDAAVESPLVKLTNSTDHLDGVIVQLSASNEVSGIRFVKLRNHGIMGIGGDLAGTWIHHNSFVDAKGAQAVFWAVRLQSESGTVTGVKVTDNQVRDGEWMGGVQIITQGETRGFYRLERNEFSDLGGRAYHLWSQGSSYLEAEIEDSKADNIGVGDKNSDSILPHLWNRSEQKVVIRNYRYRNTKQVGSRSNCAMEAFITGAPFAGPESYCNGCKLTLHILDSVFEDSVTDGIQLTNYGSNSVFDVVIRGTRILRPNPQQAGGGISLLAQNDRNKGSRTTLLVENSEVIGSGRFGIAILDEGEGYTSVVDLGGGELGSKGNNRIVGSAAAEIQVNQSNPVARHNWWGRSRPRVGVEGEKSTVDWEPALREDPMR